jgi:tetratricopeptide (TPR) repeat protein
MLRPRAVAPLALALSTILNLIPAVKAAEPWSPDAVSATAMTSSAATSTDVYKAPLYQDAGVENALDTGDYATAQTLITTKISNYTGPKGGFGEAYLRTALVESLIWQGQLNAASTEFKKLSKLLDGLDPAATHGLTADDAKELRARALDDQSWLTEALGRLDEARTILSKAIDLLQQLHAVDRQTWRLVACMSHSAGLTAAAGDFVGAEKLLEQALAQAGGSHSISPLNVADVQENLGAVLFHLGKQKQSHQHFAVALAIKNNTGALLRRYAPGPYWLSPNYRYIEGSPWSSKAFQNGVEKKIINLGPFSIEASVVRDKSAAKQTVQVLLTVVNRTNQSVEFMGRRPTFLVLNPKAFWAKLIEPTDLAAQIEKKADGKAKWIRFWGQGATQTMTTTYMGNMPFYGYGYGGIYPPVVSYGGTMPFVSRSGNMTNVMTQVPDPIAEARAFEKARQVQENARSKAADIRSNSLGPSDIGTGQTLSGSLFFDAPGLAKTSGCLVRIPIGDSQCEFRFDNIVDAP